MCGLDVGGRGVGTRTEVNLEETEEAGEEREGGGGAVRTLSAAATSVGPRVCDAALKTRAVNVSRRTYCARCWVTGTLLLRLRAGNTPGHCYSRTARREKRLVRDQRQNLTKKHFISSLYLKKNKKLPLTEIPRRKLQSPPEWIAATFRAPLSSFLTSTESPCKPSEWELQ